MKILPVLSLCLSTQVLFAADKKTAQEPLAIEQTLDAFHKAASTANLEAYFSHFSSDAVFIGTDVSERWDVKAFRAYVSPHFAKGKGWTYVPRTRHISLGPKQDFAWFDEVLDSSSYGTSRGTGVLIKEGNQWKIAQYHLTFPIPNDLAQKFTNEIQAFEKSKR